MPSAGVARRSPAISRDTVFVHRGKSAGIERCEARSLGVPRPSQSKLARSVTWTVSGAWTFMQVGVPPGGRHDVFQMVASSGGRRGDRMHERTPTTTGA